MMGGRSTDDVLACLSSLRPSVIRPGLERMRAALEALGHPESSFRALHVAGTNGKGSTCAFAEACLRQAGVKTGLYTSPHLSRFNERIQVEGACISDEELAARFADTMAALPEELTGPEGLTYFEVATLLAFAHFARVGVEVAVLEVGLGGRLDATNVVMPLACAVTSIGMDHTELLGSTLGAIAGEKAGILKPGVPAIVAPQADEALRTLRAAALRVGAPLHVLGEAFSYAAAGTGEPQTMRFFGPRRQLEGLTPALRGDHQRMNAALAVGLLELAGFELSEASLRTGLAQTRWPGRLEELPGSPVVVLDGAHNVEGMTTLVRALDAIYPGRRVHGVFSALADKPFARMLELLAPRCASVHVTPLASPRAASGAALASAARAGGAAVVIEHASVADALLAATRSASAPASASATATALGDLVLCAGSLVLIGAVRDVLEDRQGLCQR